MYVVNTLEVILRRLSEFLDRSESLKRKVKGAMIYPVVVVVVAVLILVFIMMKIVPVFDKMFQEFGLKLPDMTILLVKLSQWVVAYGWFSIPLTMFWVFLATKTFDFLDGLDNSLRSPG